VEEEKEELSNTMKERDELINKLSSKISSIEEKNKELEIRKFSDDLITSGYTPAVAEAVFDILSNEGKDSDGNAFFSFSEKTEDGKEKEHNFTLKGAISYLLASMPKEAKVNTESHVSNNNTDKADFGDVEVPEGHIKLSSGEVVKINDDEAIKKSIESAGYKTV